jgi:hypothetical protein
VVTALYLVARISGFISLLGLAYTIVLAAFTLPKVGRLASGRCCCCAL